MVHPYLKRKRKLEEPYYPNEAVKNILGKTLGVPLFQEQIMKLAIELADFTPGEADVLRKSINAWRSSAPIKVIAKRLMDGLLKSGMSLDFANQIFEQIQGFSHYGFPESHAASFALLAYASCYLKCHHPAEFACALINSQPMGFYREDTILYEAIRAQVQVLPVSVLKSQWDCIIEKENTIRLGFRLVKGLSQKSVEALIQERNQMQFKNLADFVKRSQLRSDILSKFALAGRFEDFSWNARESLWALLEYQNLFMQKDESQLSFFKHTSILESDHMNAQKFQSLSGFEYIQNDYSAFRVSVHGHPMAELRKNMNLPKTTAKDIRQMQTGSYVKTSGLVLIRQKPPTAKGVCFSTLEDESGFIDIILWKNIFEQYRDDFLNHCFLIVEGVLQRDENTVSILVKKLRPIWNTRHMDDTPLALEPDQYFH